MVTELSGVKFGLKAYERFQNRTSTQREFDLRSQTANPPPGLMSPS